MSTQEKLLDKEKISNTIIDWAATRSDDAVFDPTTGYYPFDIIAEAFKEGYEKGETAFKQTIRKDFFDNAKKTIDAVIKTLKFLSLKKRSPKKLFISITFNCSKVLISLPEKEYTNDKFIDSAYSFVSDLHTNLHDKGFNISVGFIIDYKELNLNALKSDGFDIAIDLKSGKSIY